MSYNKSPSNSLSSKSKDPILSKKQLENDPIEIADPECIIHTGRILKHLVSGDKKGYVFTFMCYGAKKYKKTFAVPVSLYPQKYIEMFCYHKIYTIDSKVKQIDIVQQSIL